MNRGIIVSYLLLLLLLLLLTDQLVCLDHQRLM